MDKSPEAFRTISEVAESLETPAHVLRFWESRFPQIKPVKRAGGRRYYRPADVALLGGIRHLLHDEGMTIRGVQKILREQGVRHVAAMSAGGEDIEFDSEDLILESLNAIDEAEVVEPEPQDAQVFALETVMRPPSVPSAVPAEVVPLRAPVEPPAAATQTLPEVALDAPEADHIWVDDEDDPIPDPPAPLFPESPTLPADTDALVARSLAKPPPTGPRDLSEGFVMTGELRPTQSSPRVDPATDDTEPGLPLFDDGTTDAAMQTGLDEVAPQMAQVEVAASDAPPDLGQGSDLAQVPLSGIAARLRALPRPVSAAADAELQELHMRLGLLHAQIAEVLRTRR